MGRWRFLVSCANNDIAKVTLIEKIGTSFMMIVLEDPMNTLNGHVTAVHYYMDVLFLGTSSGAVYAYTVRNADDFLDLDLNNWIWKAQANTASAVQDIDFKFSPFSLRSDDEAVFVVDETVYRCAFA